MNTVKQSNATERVSRTTDLAMDGVPQFLTIAEAARATGLSPRELSARIEAGTLQRRHPIVVAREDLRDEIATHKTAGVRDLLTRFVGEQRAEEELERLGLV